MAATKDDIQSLYERAKEMNLDITQLVVSPKMESAVNKIIKEQNLSLKVLVSPQIRVWNIEEYKAQPFKYDGKGNPVPISEIWSDIPRKDRREIERLVKKGKNPDIMNYV